MKQRVMALLLALSLAMGMTLPYAMAEDELSFTKNETVQEKDEGGKSVFDQLQDMNAAIMEALGKKNWEAQASAVKLTGDWRDDLVSLAKSQEGYQEEKNGKSIYGSGEDWTAQFVNWIADKAGLSEEEFPRGESYAELREKLSAVNAVKKVSRANFPAGGDLAFVEVKGQELVGIVTYASEGYATVIHGDDQGRVTKETYRTSGKELQYYADLDVLLARAGIETGKGGKAPEIPEGGVAAWTNTDSVYIRKEPSRTSKRLTMVKKARTALLVTSAEKQADGYIWYGVEYKKYTGYIRGDLVELDLSAIPAAPEAPVEKPEATEIPGCAVCRSASRGVALPQECCYEHLTGMGTEAAAAFLRALLQDDPKSFGVYISCVLAHVEAGAENVLCLGAECGAAAWAKPGAAHAENCPWHKDGLGVQERVVNIEVRETTDGQEMLILFEIYGASAYQWHEVKTVTTVVDGIETVNTTDSVLEGETGESIVVTAKGDETTTYSYYCVATITANGASIEVASKTTALSVTGAAPIVAEAILGEEINFTYTVEGAAAYQWYVDGEAITAEHPDYSAYTGANEATLTFYATAENAGKVYSCVALDENGSALGTSAEYSYVIDTAYTAVLDKYVHELAHMTLTERYTALNTTWQVAISESNSTILADAVVAWWTESLQTVYPNLLCGCTAGCATAPGESHDSGCSWYVMAPVSGSIEDEYNVYYDCSAFPEECGIAASWLTRNASPMSIYTDLADLEQDAYLNLLLHASAAHPQVCELLCCCDVMYESPVMPGTGHAEDCTWYMAVSADELQSRADGEDGFAQWMLTASEAMLIRALKAATLEHLVLDGTDLYVAREENPRATVDAETGYITDLSSGFVIARIVDGVYYPIAEAPALEQ